MKDIQSIQANKFNSLLAEVLKKIPEFKKPEFADFIKSSSHKARPISDEDFWYKRAASVLRQIYIRKIVGVNRLRTRYGGRKKRGSKPAEFRKSGGKIIRTILQQSDSAGFTERAKEKRSGRKLTEKGKQFMEDLLE